ncbi:hypothetical protein DIT71_15195 [Marinobacter vulgaris]|uniref:Tetratricopeptide repeat protein n=1 Tax=Marinobacter vulgaris TaxID=1928331 RepID=A0A2V3ZLM2_9GAMM|nr:tetratricopeptide repeat protein [Marinobacter vulgaris]PXX89848.1 hypothetical protein DIT71_15195 [Marinobacter vulgaris]TSJ68840.1 tetratricopeptide repeat protein [Marinobacter vulgaris]
MTICRYKLLLASSSWLILLLLGFVVYYPGLHGNFIFDDFPNLRALGFYGGVTDWDTFHSYVFGGFSGPTGRPISLLSFLLNANNWPADPFGFKYTNVLLHLLNGTLLFTVTLQVLRLRESLAYSQRVWIALIVAGLWLLHPYLTSTTLYIIQRMAMLSAMFCLIGICLYLHGRFQIMTAPTKGYAIMTLGVGLGTVLATFSKENGAALALMVLCLESTVVRANSRLPALNRFWKWIVLVLPSIALAILLLKGPVVNGWFQDYGTRDFSPYERVLTQFRVVLSYLQNWFIPSSSGGQIFYDDLEISRGIFAPFTTFLSAVLVIGLISFSIIKRKTWPITAFAILFYFASLAIESTTIRLEMKFDHRIYLGSAFLFLPIIWWVSQNLRPLLKSSLGIAVIALFAGLTFSASSLWGDYQKLTMVWAAQKPGSVRSQTEAAQMLFANGRLLESRELLNEAADRIPDDFRLRLTQVLVQCMTGGASPEDVMEVKSLSEAGPYRHTDFNLLNSLITSASSDNCKGISSQDAMVITEKLLNSSSYTSPDALAYAHLHYYHGLALLQAGEREKGLKMLEKALKSRSSLHMRMNIAAYKASAGLFKQALNDARFVKERLESGEIAGRAAAESPPLHEVEHFIRVVEDDFAGEDQSPEDRSR